MYRGFTELWRQGALPPKSHVSRQAWTNNYGDPIKYAVIARLIIMYIAVIVLALLVLMPTRPALLQTTWQIPGLIMVFSLMPAILGIRYFGFGSGRYFDYLTQACTLLGITPRQFATWEDGGSTLRHHAIKKLESLAHIVQYAEQTFINPYAEGRVIAMEEFRQVYDVFLQLGLIRNDGYDRYFEKVKQVIVTIVRGQEFIVELQGKPPIASIGNTREFALGQLVAQHPGKFNLELRWGTDDETCGWYWTEFNRRNAPPQK